MLLIFLGMSFVFMLFSCWLWSLINHEYDERKHLEQYFQHLFETLRVTNVQLSNRIGDIEKILPKKKKDKK